MFTFSFCTSVNLQLSSLEKAYDIFHHDNPGVGYFLVREEEEQGGGAISLHPLKDFDTLISKGGKVMTKIYAWMPL